ncbi:LysM peptidoglycan-binding domain-containing protein [Jeotgalibacillus sp. S-D1]|uniref:LysM peptidoglycan-binding domain-containing protein n=1 Tax=Jeotgalibacillus sp. S-D1 TaxID=2552189 RepID=UPI001059D2E1|nr:LysM peptidoglycan-binding domain-containing protein [Jeotgalibacillus sp. S-D1]TDL32686.1 LysM peptidoglycan-binding domain-containing protein [Jeotgalibacillus sp. S-D1]
MAIVLKKSYIYTVRAGDTIYSIARKFGSTVEAIERANHLYEPVTDPGLIFPGDVLVVPSFATTPKVTYVVEGGDTVNKIAAVFTAFGDLIAGINDLADPNQITVNQELLVPAFVYQVQQGDTLSTISRRYGISVAAITNANEGRPGFQADLVWPEYHLIIPLPTSLNIVVWTPLPGTKVATNQKLEGKARSFEASVLYQLRDANGVIVSNERFTTADEGAPKYGNFTAAVPFDKTPTATTGELWVYTRSAEDDSIRDLVKIKVYF